MPLTQFIVDAKEQRRQEMRLRNKWMVRLRWFYVSLLSIIPGISLYLVHSDRLKVVLMLMPVALLANGLFWLALVLKPEASSKYYRFIAGLQILHDVVIVSASIYLQGGYMSRSMLMFAIPILISGILFVRPAAFITATLTSVGYLVAVIAYQLVNNLPISATELLSPMTFYPALMFIIAAIVTRFSALNAMDQREQTYQQLLSMLRHQLHHPSSVMAAVVEMLEFSDHYKTWPPKDKEYLRQLKRENLRLNTMITNVLEAASKKSESPLQHPEKVNLVQMLNETTISCATGAKRLSDLRANLPNQTIFFDCQPLQLRTALDNVVENAFRYSEKGTPVTVSLTHNKDKGIITIKVSDKGPGMTKEEQHSLFQLFTRLEEHHGTARGESKKLYATGLGLYVAKVIVENHHGTLELESEQGKGTDVVIKLKEALWLRQEFYT